MAREFLGIIFIIKTLKLEKRGKNISEKKLEWERKNPITIMTEPIKPQGKRKEWSLIKKIVIVR